MKMVSLALLALLSSVAEGFVVALAHAWPADSLTQVQVSPQNATAPQGVGLGVDGESVHFWQSAEGTGVARLRGLDLGGLPSAAWPDSGLLLEIDTRPAENEILVPGPDGSVIVLWIFGDLDSLGAVDTRIRAQRFRGGQRLWGPSGVVVSRQTQSESFSVTALQDGRGGLIIAWGTRANFPAQIDLYLAHLDSNGVHHWSSDVAVCEAPGPQGGAQLLLRDDGIQVFWGDSRITSARALYTQRFDWSGVPLLAIDGVKILDDPEAGFGHLIEDGEGGVYYSYATRRLSATSNDLYLCRVDSSGTTHASWPSLGVVLSAVPNSEDIPKGLALDSTAHVIAAWADRRYAGIENSSGAVWLQRFSPQGTRTWPSDRVGIASRSGNSAGGEAHPDGQGGFFLGYFNDQATPGFPTVIRVQHVDARAAPLWRPEGVTVAAASISRKIGSILPDDSGGLFVTWLDDRFGTDSRAIFAQHVNADGTLGGSVTATQASAIESSYESGCAHVVWHTSESAGMRFQVERARDGEVYEPIGEGWPDGRGLVTVRDCGLERGESYRYRLSWEVGGARAHSAPVVVLAQATAGLSLSPPSPTPATSRTELVFSLPRAGRVRLAVHDLAGRRVALILDEAREAGTHRRTWEPRDSSGRLLPPGAYTLKLSAAGETRSERMIVVR